MIVGLGTDIIEISRIQASLKRHPQKFLDRLFTPKEQLYFAKYSQPYPQIAGRFAAKEAIAKALGTGIRDDVNWLDIEVLNNPLGKPMVYLYNGLQEIFEGVYIHLSISHCRDYATAVAIATHV